MQRRPGHTGYVLSMYNVLSSEGSVSDAVLERPGAGRPRAAKGYRRRHHERVVADGSRIGSLEPTVLDMPAGSADIRAWQLTAIRS